MIGAVFYIAPAIQFMIFGSTDVQKWNNSEEKQAIDAVENETKKE